MVGESVMELPLNLKDRWLNTPFLHLAICQHLCGITLAHAWITAFSHGLCLSAEQLENGIEHYTITSEHPHLWLYDARKVIDEVSDDGWSQTRLSDFLWFYDIVLWNFCRSVLKLRLLIFSSLNHLSLCKVQLQLLPMNHAYKAQKKAKHHIQISFTCTRSMVFNALIIKLHSSCRLRREVMKYISTINCWGYGRTAQISTHDFVAPGDLEKAWTLWHVCCVQLHLKYTQPC